MRTTRLRWEKNEDLERSWMFLSFLSSLGSKLLRLIRLEGEKQTEVCRGASVWMVPEFVNLWGENYLSDFNHVHFQNLCNY